MTSKVAFVLGSLSLIHHHKKTKTHSYKLGKFECLLFTRLTMGFCYIYNLLSRNATQINGIISLTDPGCC